MSSGYLLQVFYVCHTNSMQIQWIPLILLFLEKTLNYKKIEYAFLLGISLSLQIISSAQYTVYVSFVLPLYILLRNHIGGKKFLFQKNFQKNMLISATVAFVLSSFYLIKRLSIPPTIRTIEENMFEGWRLSSLDLLLYYFNIYLIVIWLFLPLIVVFVMRKEIRNAEYGKYIPFLILFMLGPFSILAPYYWLYKVWPFVNTFRVPLRFFPFSLICSSILSSLFLLHMNKSINLRKYRTHIVIILIISILLSNILLYPSLLTNHIFYP